jgi:hypothetical protein
VTDWTNRLSRCALLLAVTIATVAAGIIFVAARVHYSAQIVRLVSTAHATIDAGRTSDTLAFVSVLEDFSRRERMSWKRTDFGLVELNIQMDEDNGVSIAIVSMVNGAENQILLYVYDRDPGVPWRPIWNRLLADIQNKLRGRISIISIVADPE